MCKNSQEYINKIMVKARDLLLNKKKSSNQSSSSR